MDHNNVLGAVLAGGKSQRFGEDKSQVKLGDKILIDYILSEIIDEFNEVLVVSNNSINFRKSKKISLIQDFKKDLGPLGGVLTAMKWVKDNNKDYQWISTFPVDTPFFKNQILKEIEKIKVDEVPENLIEEEVKILSQGMDETEAKKNKAKFTETAKTRIKTGLILNEFGEQNKIQVSEQEIQAEVQKQLRMMPGQEKMVMDFYQKNPSALASLRGTVYEEKILTLIKAKAKSNKKEISKEEAEKILKEAHKHDHNHDHDHDHDHGKDKEKKDTKKKAETKSEVKKKPSAKASKSKPAAKKVSKK